MIISKGIMRQTIPVPITIARVRVGIVMFSLYIIFNCVECYNEMIISHLVYCERLESTS
jgi:hypothetical protein